MKTPLRRLWPLGIRLQLMCWYIGVFALLLLLSDALLYAQLRSSLLANLDAALQFHAEQIASGVTYERGNVIVHDVTGGDLPDQTLSPLEPADRDLDITFGTLIRVLDAQGKVVRVSSKFQTLAVPEESFARTVHQSAWQGDVLSHDGQAVRLYTMALTTSGRPFAIVEVGTSLRQLNSSLESLLFELLLLAPLFLFLGALGSYWLAGRAFIPIDHLTQMAQRINAGDLHQRVPIPQAQDEVQRLAFTLNAMIERLEQAFTRQRRFVADASHELRTPVATIRSMTDFASLQQLTSQEYTILLESINIEAERLGRLITDLLALAHTDEGKAVLEWETVQVDQLVSLVAINAETQAAEHGIEIEVQAQEPITLLGDEARLIQAVMNLLDNAILYTNDGGKICLSAELHENCVHILCHDTGIGITAEHLPHIFERFYRADPARMRTEGNSSGLGLSIVQWIVQQHNGQIVVESQPGRGTTFTLILPRAPEKSLIQKSPSLTPFKNSAFSRERQVHV